MTPTRLREIRTGLGLTQAGLAAVLGLTRDAIAKMEADHRPIELRTRLALAAIMAGLPPAE